MNIMHQFTDNSSEKLFLKMNGIFVLLDNKRMMIFFHRLKHQYRLFRAILCQLNGHTKIKTFFHSCDTLVNIYLKNVIYKLITCTYENSCKKRGYRIYKLYSAIGIQTKFLK